MAQNSFKRLRYAAVCINLIGLVLSAWTWTYRIYSHTRTMSRPHPIQFTWTLGVFCWLVGLIMFIAVWIVERSAIEKP